MDVNQLAQVDWARAQFALTACFHFLFVPLTLGLSFMIALMETLYYWKKDPFWLKATQFWMRLFGVNFAIGVATGLILEFEFGTNWSKYSWIVGDIFGAPLAIEGLFAFFLEATFFAVMFFGWNRVSARFHLFSTWMVAFGSNLSALWILVANGWMQYPAGTYFNIDNFRNEMLSFSQVLFSPVATFKFIHTVSSSMVVSALFVMGICAWYLIKKREQIFAKKCMVFASSFGFVAALAVGMTGDGSAYWVAQTQPAKLAAMEGLYKGSKGAGLTLLGIFNSDKKIGDQQEAYSFDIKIPYMLSFLSQRDFNAFVPGLEDLVYGNPENNIMGAVEKIQKGKEALNSLELYQRAKKAKDEAGQLKAKETFDLNSRYLGYAYLEKPESIAPPVAPVAHSFRIMVGLGFYFIVLFAFVIYVLRANQLEKYPWLLWLSLFSIPLGYLASQLGWVVAELGRQPWVIQDLLPTAKGVTDIEKASIQVTFFLFLILFSVLLLAEIRILLKQIQVGPEAKH